MGQSAAETCIMVWEVWGEGSERWEGLNLFRAMLMALKYLLFYSLKIK